MKNIGLYPRVQVDTDGTGVVSQAGGVALVETVRVAGLDRALSAGLGRWRKPMARHDPGKVITDLALTLALGGDCLADIALLRAEPGVFGAVASDPTVSRTIDALAGDAARALTAIDAARAAARARVWGLAGAARPGPRHRRGRSRWSSTPTPPWSPPTRRRSTPRRRSSGGSGSTRCGRSSTTARPAPGNRCRACCVRGTPARTPPPTTSPSSRPRWRSCPDTGSGRARGGGSWSAPTGPGRRTSSWTGWSAQRLSYSVGFTLPDDFAQTPGSRSRTRRGRPAYDGDGQVRDGAWVAEVTGAARPWRRGRPGCG